MYLVLKEQIKVHILETSECLGQNSPNSCHFWNNISVLFRILHHSSVSWDITLLYFFSWSFMFFQQKEPIKIQIWWNLMQAVTSLTFCTLMGSFCPNDIVSTTKVQKSYLSWHRRLIQSLKKNWLLVSNMTWRIWWIFSQPLKSENFTSMGSFCPKYIRFGPKNTEELSFMILNSDAKFEFPDLVVSKMAWGIEWNFIKALKILKNGTFDGLFLSNA